MTKWIQENFSWLSMAVIVTIAQLIGANFWLGQYPISIFVAGLMLLVLAYFSLIFIQFSERLLLVGAYLWTNWKIVEMFGAIYLQNGIQGAPLSSENSLFMSISIWTLLGFGQILPSDASRFWVQIEAVMGLLSNGILITLLFRVLTPWQQLVNR